MMKNGVNRKTLAIGCALIGCVGLLAIGLGLRQVAISLTTTPLRKALPASARDIHEWSGGEEGILAQDYMYLLKARITPDEFDAYVNRFGMTPHTPNRSYQYGFQPGWRIGQELEWWDPSDDVSNTYVLDHSSAWTYAKYENGYLYVVSYNI